MDFEIISEIIDVESIAVGVDVVIVLDYESNMVEADSAK